MRYIIGIDEVGRGCLAGPVTVTAVAVPANLKFKPPAGGPNPKQIPDKIQNPKLRDSKKLSPKQREEWFEYIKNCEDIIFVTKKVSPKVIDKINISAAANLAAHRAVNQLQKLMSHLSSYSKESVIERIFLDGGLFLKNKKFQSEFFANAETVIKGDEKIEVISLASIVAKVTRDRHMVKLHKKHPNYHFDIHKGYGTKLHRRAIRKHGPSDVHRKTFIGHI